MEQETNRKLDAKLKLLYSTKRITKANDDLGDAMDTDGGENKKSFVSKEVNKEVDRRIATNKKEMRKNCSDGSKNQESMSGANGRKPTSGSKQREQKSRAQLTKRQSYDNGNGNNCWKQLNANNNHSNSRTKQPIQQQQPIRWRAASNLLLTALAK